MLKKLVMVLMLSILALMGWWLQPQRVYCREQLLFVAPNATDIHHINQIHQIIFPVESASMTPNLNVGDLVVAENISR